MKRVIDLNGPEGNIFALMGTGKKLARQLGIDFDPIQKSMMSGDYENSLEVFLEHFGDYIQFEEVTQ
jgi:hypothetical protein